MQNEVTGKKKKYVCLQEYLLDYLHKFYSGIITAAVT